MMIDVKIVPGALGAGIAGIVLNVNTDGVTSVWTESGLESSPVNGFTTFGLLGIVLKAPPIFGNEKQKQSMSNFSAQKLKPMANDSTILKAHLNQNWLSWPRSDLEFIQLT